LTCFYALVTAPATHEIQLNLIIG